MTTRSFSKLFLSLTFGLGLLLFGFYFNVEGVNACCPPGQVMVDQDCIFGKCWTNEDGVEECCGPCDCRISSWQGGCISCENYKCETPCITHDCTCASGCPSGQSTTFTGELCRVINYHSDCDKGCGETKPCGQTTCYRPETNIDDPAAPTSLTFNVGAIRHTLSGNEGLRSLIAQPLSSETVTMSIPRYVYGGARAISYELRANNQGDLYDNLVWQQYSDSPLRSEDVYYRGDSHENILFNPQLGPRAVLFQNARGRIWANNLTLNECTNDVKVSPDRNGFYLINTPPVVDSIIKTYGDPTVEAGKANGCTSLEFSGREANNPIGYRVTYSDINHNIYKDVEAVYVWFANTSTGGNPPTIVGLTSEELNIGSDRDSFGFMIRKEGVTWNSIPTISGQIGNTGGRWDTDQIYVSTKNSNQWYMAKVSDGVIQGSNERQMARVSDVSVQETGNQIILDFMIEFLSSDNSSVDMVVDGTYRIRAGANDHHTFLPVGGQSLRVQPNWDLLNARWNIDLTRPVVNMGGVGIVGAQTLEFRVEGIDGLSGINRIVGDAYRTDVNETFTISRTIDKISPTPQRLNYMGERVPAWPGFLDDNNQRYNSVSGEGAEYALWYTDSQSAQDIVIDIGDNEGGGFVFYATAFDKACNYQVGSTAQNDIGAPWLMTKGGSFYSQGGASIPVRDFGSEASQILFRPHDTNNNIFGFLRSQTQLSTEFLGIGNNSLSNIISRATGVEPALFRTVQYRENINQKDYWYARLQEDFNNSRAKRPNNYTIIRNDSFRAFAERSGSKRVSSLVDASSRSIVVDYVGNLSISSDLICDMKTLVMVDGNLTINPNLTREGQVLNGCIFIVSGNIIISEGDYASETSTDAPRYDLLEGFFFAENMIDILEGDIGPTFPARDGLKIHGSILGMSSDGSEGIRIGRSLKLVDNLLYPAQVVHYDPRYLELVKYFFGGVNYTYIRETGWKP